MLYTLRHSPFACDLEALLSTVLPGDDLLLWQEGVIAGLEASAAQAALRASGLSLYALEADIIARGLSAYISPGITIIDYTDLVRLTEKHPQQMAW